MLRVNTAPRHKNAGRPAEKSCPGFLQWLRGRMCAVPGCNLPGKMEAAHVDHGGDKGMGTKVSDRFAIPLCGPTFDHEGHHAEQHRIGWISFQAKYAMNALQMAAHYWSRWHGRAAWEAKHG